MTHFEAGAVARKATAAALRREVAALRAGERRRRFPLGLHVGSPGGDRVGAEVPWPAPRWYDAALRFDMLAVLVEQAGRRVPVHGWLTRPGVPELHDTDLAWYAAAVRVFGAHEVGLAGFHAVTRTGWLDVVTGERQVWKRLRM